MIKNEVIVIGGDHYNALGVIRSLGECGIKPYFILISSEKICMSSSSKYIKKLIKIQTESEEDILKVLKNEFNGLSEKPILIPTGDPIEKLLDNNYNLLSKKYILPNIDEKQGNVIKHMDKSYQEKLCKKYNISMAKSFLINLDKKPYEIDKLPKKVIIKPDVSADGNKADILIVEGKNEINKGLDIFAEKGYKTVLIQEFLNYDMEYAMMGVSYKGNVIIPGVNSNDFIYPTGRGNTSYAEMFPLNDFEFDISNIKKMIEDMNYTGLFEVETFKVGNKLYFNEMNFRNSANLYGYHGNKIRYINLYVLQVSGNSIENEKIAVDKHYHFCIEPLHLGNVKEKRIGFFKCLGHIIKSTKLIYNRRDLKPFFMKYRHAIHRRIHK